MRMSHVVSLHRYPVKSMIGEELNATEVDEFGLLGDRAYAIVDSSDGKVASAKNPRKWPDMFNFQATLVETPKSDFRHEACLKARSAVWWRQDFKVTLTLSSLRQATWRAVLHSRRLPLFV